MPKYILEKIKLYKNRKISLAIQTKLQTIIKKKKSHSHLTF